MQWSIISHPSSSDFEYGYKNRTVHINIVQWTPHPESMRNQNNVHTLTAASCICSQNIVSLVSQRDCFVLRYYKQNSNFCCYTEDKIIYYLSYMHASNRCCMFLSLHVIVRDSCRFSSGFCTVRPTKL